MLRVSQLSAVDSFQFFGPSDQAADVAFRMNWRTTGPAVTRGRGTEVPPDDPAAFLGEIAPARCLARFEGAQLGFQFSTNLTTSDRGYALLGRERNGVFLS